MSPTWLATNKNLGDADKPAGGPAEGISVRSERGKLARFVAHEIGQLREVVRQLHAREIVRDEFCECAIHTPQPLIAF